MWILRFLWFDDSLMEKYFEDPNSLTEREILDALRAATIAGKVVPRDPVL